MTYAGRLSWLSLKESSQQKAGPEEDLAWQGLATSSSLFLRTMSLRMLHMKFPGSICLAFQALLMNEVEGKLFKSVVLSPGCPLEEIIITINLNKIKIPEQLKSEYLGVDFRHWWFSKLPP